MAMDESGKKLDDEESKDSPAADESAATEAENRSRMNAAKAFYRAMYAGEDVVPDEFGLSGKQGAPTAEEGGGSRSGPCGNCAYLEQQLTEAQAKATEWENLYKRMAADFENYRRRLDRERDEFAGVGAQKAIEAILPALDDLDRAKQTLTSNTDPKAILDSLNLVYTRFTRCLESVGVKPLEVIGEPFDPRNHEPVQEIETNKFPDGAVMHELRKGYSYKDKILRPTLVNVASNPSGIVVPEPEAPQPTESEESSAEAVADSASASEPADPVNSPADETPEDVKAGETEEVKADEVKAEEVNAEETSQAETEVVEASTDEPAEMEAAADDNLNALNRSLDGSLDALNSALGSLLGDASALAEESISEHEAKPKKATKEKKVHDISDADSEAADKGSREKR